MVIKECVDSEYQSLSLRKAFVIIAFGEAIIRKVLLSFHIQINPRDGKVYSNETFISGGTKKYELIEEIKLNKLM